MTRSSLTSKDLVDAAQSIHADAVDMFTLAQLTARLGDMADGLSFERPSEGAVRVALKVALKSGLLENRGTQPGWRGAHFYRLIDQEARARELAHKELVEALAMALGGKAVHWTYGNGVVLTAEQAQVLVEKLGARFA